MAQRSAVIALSRAVERHQHPSSCAHRSLERDDRGRDGSVRGALRARRAEDQPAEPPEPTRAEDEHFGVLGRVDQDRRRRPFAHVGLDVDRVVGVRSYQDRFRVRMRTRPAAASAEAAAASWTTRTSHEGVEGPIGASDGTVGMFHAVATRIVLARPAACSTTQVAACCAQSEPSEPSTQTRSECSASALETGLEDEFTSLMLLVDVTRVTSCRAEGHGLVVAGRSNRPVGDGTFGGIGRPAVVSRLRS